MTTVDDPNHAVQSVAALLHSCRLDAAQDVGSLARDLCISKRYVLAVENGDIHNLPGATYTLGFVRAYAEYFGLDEHEIVERYKQQYFPSENKKSLRFPSPVADAEMPKGAVLLAGVLTACVLYAAWHLNASPTTGDVNLVDPVPENLANLLSPVAVSEPPTAADGSAQRLNEPGNVNDVPESPKSTALAQRDVRSDVGAAESESPTQTTTEEVNEAVSSRPAQLQDRTRAKSVTAVVNDAARPQAAITSGREDAAASTRVKRPLATAQDVTNASPDHVASTATPADDASHAAEVIVRAVADCWIEVRNQAGKLVYAKLLEPGDSYTAPKNATHTMLIGNAGGVDVIVGGRKLPPLGRSGAVLRNVSLDPEKLRARF